jgi:hypothetical protein
MLLLEQFLLCVSEWWRERRGKVFEAAVATNDCQQLGWCRDERRRLFVGSRTIDPIGRPVWDCRT